jgi:uncharacterized protein (TIGR02145 family)
MIDNKCWMLDNMKYVTSNMILNDGNRDTRGASEPQINPAVTVTGDYNTANGTNTQSTANSDYRFYNNPMSNSYCYGTSNLPPNALTKCGYLYNWYAATDGTGTYALGTSGNQAAASICPTNFRLPSAMSNGSTPTSNGTSATAADFPVLNASMNANSLTTGSTTSHPTNWLFSGAWQGAYSGYWLNGLINQSSTGYYWSSTAYSSTYARALTLISGNVYPDNTLGKYYGFAVRCVGL